ncbi:MAG: single-stranded-DNA-specific exonuclease RecJ [Bacteroidales bacterium]|nr:single-stranded-DNA-specific exonuclease RecJ [Bacteroidales bacterium]
MQKKWIVNKNIHQDIVNQLSDELKIGKPLTSLLVQRGIYTYEEAKSFFRPTIKDIYDPFLMKDMDKAVFRVETAIANKEKVLIFGDYDVDGTSAVALMYSFLKQYIEQIEYYVPDRYEEGYGISQLSVEYAHQNQFTLMIVLDCGIKCHTEIALARQYGIDVIVCDHHLPDETLPDAYAILDPKRENCAYPYKELTGCGVGFKLVQAIAQKRNIGLKDLKDYFDLLVMSIASDVVPITGENRVFAYLGLKLINTQPRQGIVSLLAHGKIYQKVHPDLPPKNTIFTKEITINDLVFCVGPRINAAGRMDTGRSSVHLLISQREQKTEELGDRVEMHNSERRELDKKTTEEAIAMISALPDINQRRTIVAFNENWSKGIVGIVASRLVEHFYRPAIVLTLSNDMITGSARSVRHFNLHQALCQCQDLLEHFGGHEGAAGLSLKPENLQAFTERFETIVAQSISFDSTIPIVDIDEEIQLHDISVPFYKIMKQFAPFGPQNMNPTFMTRNVMDTGNVKIVGANHLKLSLYQPNNSSWPISAIGFGLGDMYDRIANGDPFHICYHIDVNEWQGKSYIQLIIKDIKFEFENFDQI